MKNSQPTNTTIGIIIYGPQGSGKTHHAAALAKHYGKTLIIDDASASAIKNLSADAIAFTNEQPTRREFIHLADALASAGIQSVKGHEDLALLSDELHPMVIEADRLAQLQPPADFQAWLAWLSKPAFTVPTIANPAVNLKNPLLVAMSAIAAAHDVALITIQDHPRDSEYWRGYADACKFARDHLNSFVAIMGPNTVPAHSSWSTDK